MQDKNDDQFDLSEDDNIFDEHNELLADQDIDLSEGLDEEPKEKLSFKQKLSSFIKDLWRNPKKRWSVIIGFSGLLLTFAILPQSRYFVLNTVGVRSSASVKVLDESTGQPLKNVVVKIGAKDTKTDDNGVANLEQLKLGKAQFVIKKRAFAEVNKTITVGWGSNPLGNQEIKPVGVQYSFDLVDFLSKKSIEKAEAVSDEYSAFSDDKGRLVLTLDKPGEEEIKITIKADGYRDEQINKLTEDKNTQSVTMVPAKKHFFVSKRSGKYDVYKIDVDGSNEQLVLSGTGNEREDMSLVSSPNKDMVAFISTRDGSRNKDGFLLSTLTLIDASSSELKSESISSSEKIQIIGWSGNYLVYVKIIEGASGQTPDRHRLISYNTDNGSTKEIAKSNYFNDIAMVGSNIFYAPSGALDENGQKFYKVDASGDNQKSVFDSEVWNIIRTDYDTLMFSVRDSWYEYDLKSNKVLATSGPPASRASRLYIDNQDAKKSLWIDQRDGKGALLVQDTGSSEDKVIQAKGGLSYPAQWINKSTLVYRVETKNETTDYVVNIDGGEPQLIKDVTNVGGLDRWYYY